MFQQHGLLPWRSVVRNVELGLEIAGVSQAERRERARVILSELGLGGFEDHYPSDLSGGMRQRAALARTLIAEPKLILMDEPFGALDAQTKIFIQEMFITYWEKHRTTVLFVTHDLAEAVALSDRVVVMSARPGHILSAYDVDIPRPRDIVHLRTLERFNALNEAIWSDLRAEALLAMRGR
ncbi:ABC-type nitrate/sulfonate/bicarbonate transport system ATPase subunit [Rhodoligotrophos appendicifer]